jgi:hypothetical protein
MKVRFLTKKRPEKSQILSDFKQKSPLKQNSKSFKFKGLFEKYAKERPEKETTVNIK